MTRLILAYDRRPEGYPALENDLKLVTQIHEACGHELHSVKVGLTSMFHEVHCPNRDATSAGIEMRRHVNRTFSGLVQAGLDAKLHDISNSMSEAVRVMSGKWSWTTIHASASFDALKRVVQTVAEVEGPNPTRKVSLMGVTVTSDIDDQECCSIFGQECQEQVLKFTRRLVRAGIPGIVCSGLELEALHGTGFGFKPDELTTMVVGVRPEGSAKGDQKRIITPARAKELGANYIVVGRPIWEADDPVKMAVQIAEELR